MLKKCIVFLLSFVIVCSLNGCGNSTEDKCIKTFQQGAATLTKLSEDYKKLDDSNLDEFLVKYVSCRYKVMALRKQNDVSSFIDKLTLEGEMHKINRAKAVLNVFNPKPQDQDLIKKADEWDKEHKELFDSLKAFSSAIDKVTKTIDYNYSNHGYEVERKISDIIRNIGEAKHWDMNYPIDKDSIKPISDFLQDKQTKSDSAMNYKGSNKNSTGDVHSSNNAQLLEAGKILSKEFGISGNSIQATSYGNSENGFLAYQDGNIILVDRKNHRLAYVEVQSDTFDHIKRCIGQPNTESSVVAYFTVKNDTRGDDWEAGSWDGNTHIIPMFITFEVSSTRQIVPGMLTTGKGARPGHMQGYLFEQRNVDLGNLFITEAPALINDADHSNISL